ncbi:MAG TPA: 23S rRNA (uracil(1939)-C(5))-methyltransferase RlmD [Pseudomonadales bacterium]|nr:23S rRNA (uracil(1939)-C(5))-methyltransferase RlmD [Pseudomonadales bacterium]
MTTLTIERLAHDLRGIAYADGVTWFVEGALPGEQVEARKLMKHQQRVDAETITVVQPVAERVVPACEYEGQCGGCGLQHVGHAAQVTLKQQVLLDQLSRIGKVQPVEVLPALVAEPWAYRRRTRIACKWSSEKKHLSVGFRERHSQTIVEIKHCAVLVPALQQVLQPLRECLSRWSQPRQLGHIELLAADNGVGMLLRVMAQPSGIDTALLQEFSALTAVSVYLQLEDKDTVQYFCGPEKTLVSTHIASNSTLACLPGDFLQGNAAINTLLIDAVLAALQPAASDSILEAFCGLGNFTLPLSKQVNSVAAVELSESMLARAAAQTAAQGLVNITWLAGNLDQFDERKLKLPVVNKILLDPPRDGAQGFCKQVSLKGIERIVYVSCNPSTLARDAAILAERGFSLRSAQVIDMFPQTSHIEALAIFEWNEALLRQMKKQKVAVAKTVQKRLKR